jgi:hypothetical protein
MFSNRLRFGTGTSEMGVMSHSVRICMAITSNGLTAYCNKEALAELSKTLERLVDSDEKDHYETHVRMEFLSDESRFEGKTPENVWVLRDKELAPLLAPHGSPEYLDFELTFMVVSEAELDDMAVFQRDGLLPHDWNADDDSGL